MKIVWNKYQRIILYIVFGVCTTFVNMLVYWIGSYALNLSVGSSTILAWVLAVLFAYLTNRKLVFDSKAKTKLESLREITLFYACRFVTGVIDVVGMLFLVVILDINDLVAKFSLNLIVFIINFIASKLLVFRDRSNE